MGGSRLSRAAGFTSLPSDPAYFEHHSFILFFPRAVCEILSLRSARNDYFFSSSPCCCFFFCNPSRRGRCRMVILFLFSGLAPPVLPSTFFLVGRPFLLNAGAYGKQPPSPFPPFLDLFFFSATDFHSLAADVSFPSSAPVFPVCFSFPLPPRISFFWESSSPERIK